MSDVYEWHVSPGRRGGGVRVNSVYDAARDAGVYVDSYSPGDGVTRYRFSVEEGDYFAVRALYTALGRKEALVWLAGYRAGRNGQ